MSKNLLIKSFLRSFFSKKLSRVWGAVCQWQTLLHATAPTDAAAETAAPQNSFSQAKELINKEIIASEAKIVPGVNKKAGASRHQCAERIEDNS